MATQGFKRKLTAILSADAVGYSRLMGEDEVATLRTLETYKGVFSDLIQQHRGRLVGSPGNNILAEFGSVVDAVQCAVAVQKEIQARNLELPEKRRMLFRIGINLGDVIEEAESIYGDGVNIAVRLESLADPGGICLSKTAFDHIETRLPLEYEYLGEQTVKNILKTVGAYKVLMEPRVTVKVPARARPKTGEKTPLLKRYPFLGIALLGILFLLLTLISMTVFVLYIYIRYGEDMGGNKDLDIVDILMFFLFVTIGTILFRRCYVIYDSYLDKIYGLKSRIWDDIKKLNKNERPLISFRFRKYPVLGNCLKWLSIVLYFGSIGSSIYYFISLNPLFNVLAGVLLLSFGPLFALGERMTRPEAESLLRKDPRPPVLLLRPFSADERRLFSFILPRPEDTLVPILKEIGPVISVGRPGETLPPSGAARLYVSDEDWQETVIHLMSLSRVVVLFLFSHIPAERTSHLSGFSWEIGQAFKELQPQQLLLMLQTIPCPPQKVVSEKNQAYFELLQGYLEKFNQKLPQHLSAEESEASFIYFAPDWSPRFLGVSQFRTPWGEYIPMMPPWGYVSMIRPFFQALGLPPPKRYVIGFKHRLIFAMYFIGLLLIGLLIPGLAYLYYYLAGRVPSLTG